MIRALPFPAAKAQGRRAAAQRQSPQKPCLPAPRSPHRPAPRCSLGTATEPGSWGAALSILSTDVSSVSAPPQAAQQSSGGGDVTFTAPLCAGMSYLLPALPCPAHCMPFLFHPVFLPSPLPFLAADLHLPPFLQLCPLGPLLLPLPSSRCAFMPWLSALSSALCQFLWHTFAF